MTNLMIAIAAWPIPSMILFLACRTILIVRLARAGESIRFVWMGVPGYVERRYSEAPAGVKNELAGLRKWLRILFLNLLISIALCIFVALPVLLNR